MILDAKGEPSSTNEQQDELCVLIGCTQKAERDWYPYCSWLHRPMVNDLENDKGRNDLDRALEGMEASDDDCDRLLARALADFKGNQRNGALAGIILASQALSKRRGDESPRSDATDSTYGSRSSPSPLSNADAEVPQTDGGADGPTVADQDHDDLEEQWTLEGDFLIDQDHDDWMELLMLGPEVEEKKAPDLDADSLAKMGSKSNRSRTVSRSRSRSTSRSRSRSKSRSRCSWARGQDNLFDIDDTLASSGTLWHFDIEEYTRILWDNYGD